MAFLEGYLVGLALIVLIGPVLFVLLGSTLEHGRLYGFAVAIGIFTSDIVAVGLCALGLGPWLQGPAASFWLALLGGCLLAGLGLRYLIWPRLGDPKPARPTAAGWLQHFTKGFLVNFVNPFVFAVWLGITTLAVERHGYDLDLALFLAGAVLGILSLDTAKVLLAHRIRPWLRSARMTLAFRLSGLLLLGFGLRLVLIALWP
jgi:threonine/homoserine/homoserine lactone efflux protein